LTLVKAAIRQWLPGSRFVRAAGCLSTPSPRHEKTAISGGFQLERAKGFEPSTQPWQGPARTKALIYNSFLN
jgi:hypothetical protein